jgi:DNA helicase HerA-like ATPase
MKPALNLGAWRYLDGSDGGRDLILPAQHLVTHGVVVGMTGSGKTGLVTVMIEEAAKARVPTIVIDVKGDLPNLLADESLVRARALAEERRATLAEWGISEAELAAYAGGTHVRVLTPGVCG